MLKLPLETNKFDTKNGFPWTSCAPFVENSRGVLIHRPRRGATFNLHKNPHIGISFWCGMSVASEGKNLTFLASPPEGRILCEKCEAAAVAHGMPSADELAGRHVHKGRTVAVAHGMPSADELAGRHVHKGRTVAVVTCCKNEAAE